jgi:hypothetical protein
LNQEEAKVFLDLIEELDNEIALLRAFTISGQRAQAEDQLGKVNALIQKLRKINAESLPF